MHEPNAPLKIVVPLVNRFLLPTANNMKTVGSSRWEAIVNIYKSKTAHGRCLTTRQKVASRDDAYQLFQRDIV